MQQQSKEKCLQILMEILKTMKSASSPQEILSRTIDLIVRILHCQSAAVVLIDPRSEYLRIECSHGISHTFQKQFRQSISTGIIGDLLWNNKTVIIEDGDQDSARASQVRLEHPFRSCVCIQIGVDHRALGYLYVDSSAPHAFEAEDVMFLQSCADLSGLAYQKCWLTEENLRLERFDPETGVEKLSAFQERLQTAVERGSQFHQPFAVVLVDVDNFKSIGNTYGLTAAGDLLKGMAGIIKSSVRLMDVAGRFGFDEFILLRENVRPAEAACFADAIRSSIEKESFTSRGIRSTVSVGVALFPQNGTTGEELIIAAKHALFEAQKTGRNKTVALFSTENEDSQKQAGRYAPAID